MSIETTVEIVQTALWPQGDARDPLGVWGFRLGVTGDASGDPIQVQVQVPANENAARLYTCYSLTVNQLTGAFTSGTRIKTRLLTSWPNVDPLAGVQAYGRTKMSGATGSAAFNSPRFGFGNEGGDAMGPNDRFLLLFDPRPAAGILTIIELEWEINTNLAVYAFEGYGYWWDRGVWDAPGGPRHPGSS